MQEKKIYVETISKYGMTYDIQRMNTLIFDELSKTAAMILLQM